ncbi:EboA domain-containing protein [Kitasatospora sp. NBC_01539]|uniref:EboA domain-containing protein n=1 Tax=Kitasatospora sp. NBC_01539 TaxID=2903577 RepID=UPI0038600ACF
MTRTTLPPATGPTPSFAELRTALALLPAADWLASAARHVTAADRDTRASVLGRRLAAAARRCGRSPLPTVPGWTADEAARAVLLGAVGLEGAALAEVVTEAYRAGDTAEKRAVLKALPLLGIGHLGVPLLLDAVRTNDPRLLAAALGPAADHLDDAIWRQSVLKCVFTGVPLTVVHRLDRRADATLATMLAGFAEERRAAGRPVPADAAVLLERLAHRRNQPADAAQRPVDDPRDRPHPPQQES